jgi:hypothetical protein
MINCECGASYNSVPVWPLHCRCGVVLHRHQAAISSPVESCRAPRNAWQLAHSHLADCIEEGVWDEAAEREWYEREFLTLVPKSCCADNWGPIAETIDWSTAESVFHSFWRAHNEVSIKHAGKEPISYDRCRALYLQQPTMDDCCVAVTSLAVDRVERQAVCLESWRRVGLSIFAVQSPEEIEHLRDVYPGVQWIESADSPPLIHDLASVAVKLDRTVMLINSDIEIRGEQRLIRNAIAAGAMIGIRHNYDSQWWQAKVEEWGIDVFSFTPQVAAELPRIPFRIGQPMWDYWALHFFRDRPQKWIREPLFFHQAHALRWTQSQWLAGLKLFTDHYAIPDFDSLSFRRSFEPN